MVALVRQALVCRLIPLPSADPVERLDHAQNLRLQGAERLEIPRSVHCAAHTSVRHRSAAFEDFPRLRSAGELLATLNEDRPKGPDVVSVNFLDGGRTLAALTGGSVSFWGQ